MGNQSFVRTEMLGEESPPTSQTGIVKWLLENLFSNVTNSILTIVAIYFIFSVLSGYSSVGYTVQLDGVLS